MEVDNQPAPTSWRQFDLETYISNYTGHTKINRLVFIASKCREENSLVPRASEIELEALKLAHSEVTKTNDVNLYFKICEEIKGRLGQEYAVDQNWADALSKKNSQRLEKLEDELTCHKMNLIKESIRMGHNDLGDFHYECGDLGAALKSYVRTRDYCTNSKHIIQMCLNVIKVSIESSNYSYVTSYVAKAEQTPEVTDPVVIAKLKASAGLSLLEEKKYKLAARKFLETTIDLNTNFTDVIAPQDIAVYGALCALATFDRAELKAKVIDNAPFKNFLELVPEVRELLHDFYGSRYGSCLGYMQSLECELSLDIHLHVHLKQLYSQIRNKALIQYFSPYLSVDLRCMAEAFKTGLTELELEIANLIMEGQIQGRIDSHNKILYARQVDQRSTTYQKVLEVGEEFVRNSRTVLLRMEMYRKGLASTMDEEMDAKRYAKAMRKLDRGDLYGERASKMTIS